MHKVVKRVSVLIALAMISVMFNIIPVSAASSTYYVDSANGNDGNNGTSASSAWKTLSKVSSTTFQPGDQILFKRGGIWSGQLVLNGSGTSGNPIKVDAYGSGNKPIINGSGLGNNNMGDPASAAGIGAVYLHNVDYWEVNNLEVTNGGTPDQVWRAGIMYRAEDGRVHNHIYIKNCNVHDVMGIGRNNTPGVPGEHSYQVWNDSAGILIQIGNAQTGGARTYANDVWIDGCQSNNNYSKAITTDDISWKGPGYVTNVDGQRWYAFTNLRITNNTMDNNQGDGISVYNADGPLVEYNTASNNHQYTGSSYSVAMWPMITRNAVFQHNECYGTRTNIDGQAFDLDWETKNCVIQYNFSHDNEGGMQLICNEGTKDCNDNICRYNISQNDGSTSNQVFRLNGASKNPQIYNNTVYLKSGRHPSIIYAEWKSGYAVGMQFKNNIIFSEDTPNEWVHIQDLNSNGAVYSNNLIYAASGGHAVGEPSDPHKVVADPLFVSKGTATNRNDVDGYKLQTGSPAIDAGVKVTGSELDYWGNDVSVDNAPNIGAFNGPAGPPPPPDTEKPSVPGGVNATAVSMSQIDISWNASTDNVAVKGYYVYRGAEKIATTGPSVRSYSDRGLAPNTTYTYTVRAFDTANPENVSDASPAASAKTLADLPPTAPSGLSGSALSSSQVSLTWNASSDDAGVASYKVFRNGAEVGSTTRTDYTDTGLAANTAYTYKVQAVDTAGGTSPFSNQISVTTLSGGTVNNVVSNGDFENGLTNWNLILNNTGSGTGVGTLSLETSNQISGSKSAKVSVTNGGGADWAVVLGQDLAPFRAGETYKVSFKARATASYPTYAVALKQKDAGFEYLRQPVTMEGGVKSFGPFSVTLQQDVPNPQIMFFVGFYTGEVIIDEVVVEKEGGTNPPPNSAPSVPTGLAGTPVSSSQINLTWNASTDDKGVAGYNVYRNGIQVGTAAATSYSDTGLTANTTYQYTVSAYDSDGATSAQCTAISVKTNDSTPPPAGKIGNDGSGSAGWYTAASGGVGTINAVRFQASSDMSVSRMHIKISGDNGAIKMAIYSDNSGSLGSFLMGTEEKSGTQWNWNTFNLTSSQALTGGSYYWLVVWTAKGYNIAYDNGGTQAIKQVDYTSSWPATITGASSGSRKLCIYAD